MKDYQIILYGLIIPVVVSVAVPFFLESLSVKAESVNSKWIWNASLSILFL